MPRPLPPGLQVRQARADDVPSLATLLSLTPDDGTLYQYPHVLKYPDDMHLDWLRPLVHDPTSLIRIVVVPVDGKDKFVGFSCWTRQEADPLDPTKTRPAKIAAEVPVADEVEKDITNDSPPSEEQSEVLVPNEARAAAIERGRKRGSPSPAKTTPCYELGGLVVHPDYQGHGIGSLLVRWGLDEAAKERVPVFVGGETQGVDFYEKALGFQRLSPTEFWLDAEGRDITREEVKSGNEGWKKENGGVSGAELVWLPDGYVFELDNEVYKG
ncbi:Acyl-n-acyltransferase [Mycena sanguinolenta]|uniref:Acyl-n-acyltransferase n=1 Tax=Mycena sanguinolenta TaxID=230812 RepID=A0A8H7D0N9_9AGAR|nr:Acyl-n-acyltransferase [Mycena sanguinolenta]